MFNRYWRNYPWMLQVILFMLTVFTLASFATFLVLALVPKLSGMPVTNLAKLSSSSPPGTIRVALITQALSHAGIFMIPALIFALCTHPRIKTYLGLRLPGRSVHWLYVTGIILGLLPVFLWAESWMIQHLKFGQWAKEMQEANDNAVLAFLSLNTGGDILLLVLIMAFLPAFGEELLFRGVLLRLLHRRVNNGRLTQFDLDGQHPDAQRMMIFPIVFTSLLFASIHTNPYGFIFILIAGIVLALIYNLTGSLLCSIWAHFVYNGTQVVGAYYSRHSSSGKELTATDQIPTLLPVIGLALFAFCFYMLVKTQTPLAPDWSDDFKGERIEPNQSNL